MNEPQDLNAPHSEVRFPPGVYYPLLLYAKFILSSFTVFAKGCVVRKYAINDKELDRSNHESTGVRELLIGYIPSYTKLNGLFSHVRV